MFIFHNECDSCVQAEQLVVIYDLMSEEPQRFWGKTWVYVLVYLI